MVIVSQINHFKDAFWSVDDIFSSSLSCSIHHTKYDRNNERYLESAWIDENRLLLVGGKYNSSNVFSCISEDSIWALDNFDYPDQINADNNIKRRIYGGSLIKKRPGHNQYVWVGD